MDSEPDTDNNAGLPDLPEPLPDGWVPLEMIAVIKCIDEDGDPSLALRHSDGITTWEMIGMLQAGLDARRDDMRAMGEDD